MSWIPIYSGIVDSSLWDLEDYVIKVFLTILAEKGPGDIYSKTNYALARASRKTEAEVEKALKVLSGPDRLRPGQDKEGRRIERVEGGWRVINAAFYRKQMSEELKRYRNAKAQKAWRERQAQVKKGPKLPGEDLAMRAETAEEAEAIGEASLPDQSPTSTSKSPQSPGLETDASDRGANGSPGREADPLPASSDDNVQVGLPVGQEFLE